MLAAERRAGLPALSFRLTEPAESHLHLRLGARVLI